MESKLKLPRNDAGSLITQCNKTPKIVKKVLITLTKSSNNVCESFIPIHYRKGSHK